MSMGPGIVGPGSFPIRQVKGDRPKNVGRVKNPIGHYEMARMGAGAVVSSEYDVEKPTRVNGSVRTAQGD